MLQTIKIYCANCKAYILDADLNKLNLPFKGWMFSYPSHVEWDTAFEPDAQGKDLVCPMCEWQFHQEPLLMCQIHIPGKEKESYLQWMLLKQIPMLVKHIPSDPDPAKLDKSYMIPDLSKKPEQLPPEEKPDGQKRQRGRPKGSGKLSKPAITRRDKRGRSETPDPSEDQERRDRNPANHPQFGQLADGGVCIDTGAGSSSEEG